MRIKLSSILLFVVILLALIAFGAWIGSMFDHPWRGGIYAGLVGFSVLLWLWKPKERARLWLIPVMVCLVLANELDGWVAMVATGLAVLCVLIVSASGLRELYSDRVGTALWQHIKNTFGINEGFHVLDAGKTWVPRRAKDGQFLGPRVIIVRPGTAATLVDGGKRSRVVGPSLFVSDRWEHVKNIYNLEPKQQDLTFDDVLTKEMMSLHVTLTATYGIDIEPAIRTGDAPWSDEARQRLANIDANVPDWEHQTRSVIEGELRRQVSEVALLDVLGKFVSRAERQEREVARQKALRQLSQANATNSEAISPRSLDMPGVGRRIMDQVNATNSEAISPRSLDMLDVERRAMDQANAANPEAISLRSLDMPGVAQRTMDQANARLAGMGIRICAIVIKAMQPSTDVIEAKTSNWLAQNQAAIDTIKERGRSEAWADALDELAASYKNAHTAGMKGDDLRMEVLRRLLEMFTRESATNSIAVSESIRALTAIRQAKP